MRTVSGFAEIFSLLSKAKVDYIVVGSLSAVLRHVPIPSMDVQLVHSTEPDHVKRLLSVLESIDAVYRMDNKRRPTLSDLSQRGRAELLMTKFGPLDLACTLGKDLTYSDLLTQTDEMELVDGLSVRILKLENLIELMKEIDEEKDRAVLPILRRTLDQIRKSAH